ncbi:MAG: CoA-binding protein [Steroidobacteraceae bacterium]
MKFENPSHDQIAALLRSAHNIAVIGLSADPSRPSYGVARCMQRYGYRIFPVTPQSTEILGEPTHPDLAALVASMPEGERIDIVDVFRRSEHVSAIADECIRLHLPALWLQLDVIDAAAAQRAQAAGIFTVMDRCIYRERAAL